MTPLALSIVVPWYQRREIKRTLAANKAYLNESTEVLIVNYGGCVKELQELTHCVISQGLRLVNIVACSFNKAAALNIGIYLAQADTVMLLDADIYLTSNAIIEKAAELQRNQAFIVQSVFESSALGLSVEPSHLIRYTNLVEIELRDGSKVTMPTNSVSFTDGSRRGTGLLCCSRSDLLSVGGLNSRISTWGWEDVDVLLRLKLGAGVTVSDFGECVHVTHGDDARNLRGTDRASSEVNGIQISLASYADRNFQGTLLDDVVMIDT